jgi:hypothetical protein
MSTTTELFADVDRMDAKRCLVSRRGLPASVLVDLSPVYA